MKTLIFDFDGTLADTFSLTVDIFHELTHRSQALSADQIRTLRGHSAREAVKKMGIRWYRLPFLLAKWRKRLHERLDEVHPFPGIDPVLRDLHKQGNRLFVVSTNDEQTIERFLEAQGLRPYFEKLYGSIGLYGKAKVLRKIMREFSLGVEDCLYIGDEVRDIHAAQKANVKIVSVSWGYNSKQALAAARPYRLIDQPSDLLNVL